MLRGTMATIITLNTRYDEVFKSQCPDAYSWQFDDLASENISVSL